jgi:kynurenine 3-monooxygenase
MRDRVGSRSFLITKKLEHALEKVLPGTYLSRYEMVSFTTIPYAEVIDRARKQQRVVAVAAGGAVLAAATLATAIIRRVSGSDE